MGRNGGSGPAGGRGGAAARLPYLAASGAILCWASLAAALGQSLNAVAPEQVLFWGMLIAGVFLSAWNTLRGVPPWRAWPGLRGAAWGVYGIFGYHALLVFAFALAPRVQANILNYTWPLWIIVLGSFTAGHRFSWTVAAGGVLGLAGVALVIGVTDIPAAGGPGAGWGPTAWGLTFALAAGLCWGSFTVGLRRFAAHATSGMAWFCLLSAAASALLALARGVPLALAPGQAALIVYIGLVPLGLAFQWWDYAAQRCNLQVLGLLSYFTPPLSTLLLAASSGTPVGWPLAAGLALILAGSLWAGRALR